MASPDNTFNVGEILRQTVPPKSALRVGQHVMLVGRITAISDGPPPSDLMVDFGDARGIGTPLRMQVSSRQIVAIDVVAEAPAASTEKKSDAPPPGPHEPPRPQKPRMVG